MLFAQIGFLAGGCPLLSWLWSRSVNGLVVVVVVANDDFHLSDSGCCPLPSGTCGERCFFFTAKHKDMSRQYK